MDAILYPDVPVSEQQKEENEQASAIDTLDNLFKPDFNTIGSQVRFQYNLTTSFVVSALGRRRTSSRRGWS